MKLFRRLLAKSLLLLAMPLLFVGNARASEAPTCGCYCGDARQGAVVKNPATTPDNCAATCTSEDLFYVGCFGPNDPTPDLNPLCWTQGECESYETSLSSSGRTSRGSWGGQSEVCARKITGENTGYCYGPLIPTQLNTPLFGTETIDGFAQYAVLLYKLAIPLAAIIGVLMLTISGFQYMTAGGNKGAVAKAKGRMEQTVFGLIILMSLYAVAFFIDPRLTRFAELRPPLIREIALLRDGASCEELKELGFEVTAEQGSSAAATCGKKGTITSVDNAKGVSNPPKVGASCYYSSCAGGKGALCVLDPSNAESPGSCVTCSDVSDLNLLGQSPSKRLCEAIASAANAQETNDDHIYSCYYDADFSEISGSDAVGIDECVSLYTGGDPYINCNTVKEIAKSKEDGCDAYEYLNANSFGWADGGGLSEILGVGSADEIEDIKGAFSDICTRDICSVAGSGTTPHSSCIFIDTGLLEDIWDLSLLPTDNYGCEGNK